MTLTGPGARTIAIPEPRPNLTIITARHYSRVEDQSERPRPIPADVTKAGADELRALWGPFVGEAGTYEVTADKLLTMRPIAAKNPAVMGPGVFITYSYLQAGWRHDVGDPTAKPEWPLRQSSHSEGRARRMTNRVAGGAVPPANQSAPHRLWHLVALEQSGRILGPGSIQGVLQGGSS